MFCPCWVCRSRSDGGRLRRPAACCGSRPRTGSPGAFVGLPNSPAGSELWRLPFARSVLLSVRRCARVGIPWSRCWRARARSLRSCEAPWKHMPGRAVPRAWKFWSMSMQSRPCFRRSVGTPTCGQCCPICFPGVPPTDACERFPPGCGQCRVAAFGPGRALRAHGVDVAVGTPGKGLLSAADKPGRRRRGSCRGDVCPAVPIESTLPSVWPCKGL